MTGQPDGPPTLPPFGLADGIAGLAGAIATMLALYSRDARGGSGQVIDVAIIEPILTILGAQISVYDQLGLVPERTGNRSANNAPRNTYRTRDDKWVAISTSAQSIAERVMRLVGHPEVIDEPWFASGIERATHDELDVYVASWIAERDQVDVVRDFEDAQAAIAPIYDAADVSSDPQFAALNSIITVPDEELGPLKMQNVLFRMLGTPGKVRWSGRRLGQDTLAVLAELGIPPARVEALRAQGVC
jgi:formyl-CoA transferase